MSKKKPSSFAPYVTTTDADQVRAAFLAAGQMEGYASISELIETATLKEVRRLQRKHNNARPCDGAGPGSAPEPNKPQNSKAKHEDRQGPPA